MDAVEALPVENAAACADKNEEVLVAEVRQFRESVLRLEDARDHDSALKVDANAGVDPVEFCAYNQTARRFISNQVVLAPLAAFEFEERLSRLTPNSGIAIWIVPIRELLSTSFRLPVDLLYLDENCFVVAAAHSFPIGRPSSSIAAATTILALPAHAVVSSGIETGDQLLVCGPDEMERRLLPTYAPRLEIAVKPQLLCEHAPAVEQEEYSFMETRPSSCDDVGGSSASEQQERLSFTPTGTPADDSVVSPSEPEEPQSARGALPPSTRNRKSKKKWWQKLLDEPDEDDREARRLALPGLVAYFFTGGVPAAHKVRNISTSGLYVVTSERWYKGTVVRITLTDERDPTAQRSITLHGMVVRWTDDGVALQFIFEEKKGRNRVTASTLEHLPAGASVQQIEDFLVRLKSGS